MKKISVLSGKGGTGKTLISVSLAESLSTGRYVDLLDSDIEEPNCHIFIDNKNVKENLVNVPVPVIDELLCNRCKLCVEQCKFNAISIVNNNILYFEENCRKCGLCSYLCPAGAIREVSKSVGIISKREVNNIILNSGVSDVENQFGFPIIMKLRSLKNKNQISVIDCPPGVSVNLLYAICETDYCIIVTEPTIFGLNDLKLVIAAIKLNDIPFGIIVNKYEYGMNIIDDFCRDNSYEIIMKIPYEKKIAEFYSNGLSLCKYKSTYYNDFKNVYKKIVQ